jgi:hypothetical protein
MAGAHRPDVTAIPLGRPSPGASSNQPERRGQRTRPCGAGRRRVSLLFGFAPGGACHAADVAARAVRSYRTLSPLPSRAAAFWARDPAVCFLWRFPWGRPRRTLSGAVSVWSPDFPPLFRRRPSGRLAENAYGSEAKAVKHKQDFPSHMRGTKEPACSLKRQPNYGIVALERTVAASAASFFGLRGVETSLGGLGVRRAGDCIA